MGEVVRLLGIDFEATSLDTGTARLLEVGAVLWDTERRAPLKLYSELVDPLMPVPPEITAITGITGEMVEEFGLSEGAVVHEVRDSIELVDYVVAHFGSLYDEPLFEAACGRYMCLPPERVWIDTSVDVKYPEGMKTRNLQHLAAEHGFLNPFRHRAVFDVMTMLRILDQYDLDTVIVRAKEPMVFLEACVSFEEKEKAKERGYRWCPPKRVWWKSFKFTDSIVEQAKCGFSTKVLPEAPE